MALSMQTNVSVYGWHAYITVVPQGDAEEATCELVSITPSGYYPTYPHSYAFYEDSSGELSSHLRSSGLEDYPLIFQTQDGIKDELDSGNSFYASASYDTGLYLCGLRPGVTYTIGLRLTSGSNTSDITYCQVTGSSLTPQFSETATFTPARTSINCAITPTNSSGTSYLAVYYKKATDASYNAAPVIITQHNDTATANISGLAEETEYNIFFVGFDNGETYATRGLLVSDVYTVSTSNTVKLATPTNLSLTRTTISIIARWSSVSNASSYTIAYKLSTESSWSTTTSTTTSKSITGLTSGKTYDVKVMATSTDSDYVDSDYSSTVQATVKIKLAAPDPRVSATTSSLTCSWHRIKNAVSYEVKYRSSTASSVATYRTARDRFELQNLASGETWFFSVIAVADSSSNYADSRSDFVSGTTLYLLPTPSNLAADLRTNSSITLTWTEVANASSYQIVQCDSAGTTTYATETATGTTTTFSGLSQGTTYYFKIRAIGDKTTYASSDYSSILSVATRSALPTPSLSISCGDSVIATITETASATTFHLEYRVYGTSTWNEYSGHILSEESNSETVDLTDVLTGGTVYEFRAYCSDSSGEYEDSAYSEIVSFKLFSKVAYKSLKSRTTSAISFYTTNLGFSGSDTTWIAEYRKRGTETWLTANTSNGSQLTVSASPLIVDSVYDFRIRLTRNEGESTWFYVAQTTKGNQTATPPTCTIGSTTIAATWTPPTGYNWYQISAVLNGAVVARNAWTQATSDTLTGLAPGTTYTVRVQYRITAEGDAYENDGYRGTVDVTTLHLLATPTGLSATNITSTSARLSWGAVTNAVGYKVEYRAVGASAWLEATE